MHFVYCSVWLIRGLYRNMKPCHCLESPPTPIVSASQWAEIRSHFPCDDYIARIRMPDDLYVMHYNDQSDYVKIGRSKDVETRRRDLESGHMFCYNSCGVPFIWPHGIHYT